MTSEEFRQIRRHLGLNQTELAGRLGMTQPMISRIERGDREPTNQQGAAILLLRELLTKGRTKMNAQQIAKEFASLPAEAMPQCYSNDPVDEPQDVRLAVDLIAAHKVATGMVFGDLITLYADRDGWRDGIAIEVD